MGQSSSDEKWLQLCNLCKIMEWIHENWQFLSALVTVTYFLVKLMMQTRKNSSDILRVEKEMKDNKKESDETNKLLFSELKEMRRETMSGFKDITDKLFGLAKDGRLSTHKETE